MTETIIKMIEDLGWKVEVTTREDHATMVATKGDDRHEVSVDDWEAPYLCACQLAIKVGIDLEG